MRTDACVKFKQLLNKYNIYNDFRSRTKHLGLKYDSYVMYVEAIYAFRRIVNLYDDSIYAKAAVEWEDMVVLNHFSKTIEQYTAQHGMQTVIKVIHALQEQGKWTVPIGIEGMQKNKDTLTDSLAEATKKETPTPSLAIHTPKPTLPDTAPLPTPKPTNEMKPANLKVNSSVKFSTFDSDDGQFEILDLSSKRVEKNAIDNYHISVTCRSSNRIKFNSYITELARKANAMFMHLRTDKIQGKTFIVLSVKELPGSIPCKWNDKAQHNLVVNSKVLTVYLRKGRTEDTFQRHVSTNLSIRPDFLSFELFDD